MTLNGTLLTVGVAIALAAASAHASDHRSSQRSKHEGPAGMQAVKHQAATGQPGHGWRYFADVREHRAVVISPSGDYFYSRGKGLTIVFKGSIEQKAG